MVKELKKNEVMISLDNWSKQYINELLKIGGYMSVSEIIREAIRGHVDNYKRPRVPETTE